MADQEFIIEGHVLLPVTLRVKAGSLAAAVSIADTEIDELAIKIREHLGRSAANLAHPLGSDSQAVVTSVRLA